MPLYFLMRLQHVKLPLHVSTPAEIKIVSALKATGLIEATFHLPQSAVPGTYVGPQSASVHCITDAGVEELEHFLTESNRRRVAA